MDRKTESESSDEEVQQNKLASVLKRYQSSKGAADKRKETSKTNMAKARAAKLAALAAAKEKKARQVEISDSSDSDSDEEIVVKKKVKKGKSKQSIVEDEGEDRKVLGRVEKEMMKRIFDRFAEEKLIRVPKKGKKTIIQINHPAAPHTSPNSGPMEVMKQEILNF